MKDHDIAVVYGGMAATIGADCANWLTVTNIAGGLTVLYTALKIFEWFHKKKWKEKSDE